MLSFTLAGDVSVATRRRLLLPQGQPSACCQPELVLSCFKRDATAIVLPGQQLGGLDRMPSRVSAPGIQALAPSCPGLQKDDE